MNRTKLFILALAGIFAVACATDGVDQMGTTPQQTAMLKKFVNTPQAAVKGELIIYVDEATAEQLSDSFPFTVSINTFCFARVIAT